MDPISIRIDAVRARRGVARRTVLQLAGVDSKTWQRHCRNGRWRTKNLSSFARVLRVELDELTGVA